MFDGWFGDQPVSVFAHAPTFGAFFFSGQSLASFSTPLSSCPFQGAEGEVVGWGRIGARGWDGPTVNTYHWNFTVWLISVQLFVLLVAGMSAHQNALSGTPSDRANFFFFQFFKTS